MSSTPDAAPNQDPDDGAETDMTDPDNFGSLSIEDPDGDPDDSPESDPTTAPDTTP